MTPSRSDLRFLGKCQVEQQDIELDAGVLDRTGEGAKLFGIANGAGVEPRAAQTRDEPVFHCLIGRGDQDTKAAGELAGQAPAAWLAYSA